MDLTIFDVTDLPENAVRAGDYVELFGKNVVVDDVARSAGTIGYEILTSIGLRHERRYSTSRKTKHLSASSGADRTPSATSKRQDRDRARGRCSSCAL